MPFQMSLQCAQRDPVSATKFAPLYPARLEFGYQALDFATGSSFSRFNFLVFAHVGNPPQKPHAY
jgi:hypothetical protein